MARSLIRQREALAQQCINRMKEPGDWWNRSASFLLGLASTPSMSISESQLDWISAIATRLRKTPSTKKSLLAPLLLLCPYCGHSVTPSVTISGFHYKASCPGCRKYIKFLSKNELKQYRNSTTNTRQ